MQCEMLNDARELMAKCRDRITITGEWQRSSTICTDMRGAIASSCMEDDMIACSAASP
jgi:hypothetical protein